MTTQRKKYSKEYKIDAVNLIVQQGYTIAHAARSLGINANMLARWRDELSADAEEAFPGKGHMTSEKEELHRLRQENQRLRMEREILKKATAFFAKESK